MILVKYFMVFMFYSVVFAGKRRIQKIVKRTPTISYPEENYNQTRILNAVEVKLHEAPFIVSLTRTEHGKHYCAGVIIASNLVVTTAHCADNFLNIFVHAGIRDRSKRVNGQIVQAARKIIHKDYTGGFNEYDIALLVLSDPLVLDGEAISTINLPTQRAQIGDVNCTLFGWGRNEPSNNGTIVLMATKTQLLTSEACKHLLPPKAPLRATNVCTSGQRGLAACNADSGAPLVIYENSTPVLVGLSSWLYSPCGQKGFPSVYTCIISHTIWIKKQREFIN